MSKLIALSGKKGHGKDLICDIVEYLTCPYYKDLPMGEESFNEYMTMGRHEFVAHWKRVRFADKLKDIVCMILGCTREELEDRVFKETPLGKEWERYVVRFDNEDQIHYISVSMEEAETWAMDEATKYASFNVPSRAISIKLEQLTPRLFLQYLGTEGGRKVIHPDIWVNATFAEWKPIAQKKMVVLDPSDEFLKAGGQIATEWRDVEDHRLGKYPRWLISDCRFPNEAERVLREGGTLIRVNRPSIESTDTHPSEISLDDYDKFHYTIINDGSINDLIHQVKAILITKGFLN